MATLSATKAIQRRKMHEALRINEEVADALNIGGAVVALESTIITHGMAFPVNLEIAKDCEAAVRSAGAIPATIAIIEGKLVVGVAPDAIERLARGGQKAAKASRRDVAAQVALDGTAGTTVAVTMQIAEMAGIRLFATGGIGGVHRGAAETFDISADLSAFADTPVAVVCSGAKSILDIPKTLEVLETKGVPVIGYRTDRFPAFYARDSGHTLDYRLDDAGAIARVIDTQRRLGIRGGILIANPVPEADALDGTAIEREIGRAIADAARAGIRGKALTPYLLGRVVELTGGRSLKANLALVRSNAALAAEIAVALAGLGRAGA
ncbi:MAG: pseudouridine-5'-phosphate glycosidase [Cucumibacter sp.]